MSASTSTADLLKSWLYRLTQLLLTSPLLLFRQRVSTILHIEDAQKTQRNPDRAYKPDIIDKYSKFSSGVYGPMQREGRFPDTRPVDQRIDTRPYQPSTYTELLDLEASLPQRLLMAKVQVRLVPCAKIGVAAGCLRMAIPGTGTCGSLAPQ